ncbi:MAG: N-acetyltransferase [Rhodanobacter sp.]|nr:MAG: N-acetyltransferase [Rhodanobacter sp.]
MPPPAVCVAPVTPALRAAVLRLRVSREQAAFVSPPALTLPDAERCAGSQPMAILLGDAVVGYYRIERSARSLTGAASERRALGLRSFQIDLAHQGQGLGGSAMRALLVDLAARCPHASGLLLTVSPRNAVALKLYRRAGFVDRGALYHDARTAPEHLWWRVLP